MEIEENLAQWDETLDEQERKRREVLIHRVDELLHTSIIKETDCLMIYEILLQAVQHEQADAFERYMINCLNDNDEEEQ